MRKKYISLNDFTESLISISDYNNNINEVDGNYRRMINSVKNIIQGELTEKQRICIYLYYDQKMKMKDIAQELGVGISSISRHIKKAKERLKKTMTYYFFKNNFNNNT